MHTPAETLLSPNTESQRSPPAKKSACNFPQVCPEFTLRSPQFQNHVIYYVSIIWQLKLSSLAVQPYVIRGHRGLARGPSPLPSERSQFQGALEKMPGAWPELGSLAEARWGDRGPSALLYCTLLYSYSTLLYSYSTLLYSYSTLLYSSLV